MDTQERTNPAKPAYTGTETGSNRSGRVFGGLIIVTVGALLLARQMGVFLPYWLFSWQMLLIALGMYLGFRHSFSGYLWLILIIVGSALLVSDITDLDIRRYTIPIVIIAVGLFMMLKPRHKPNHHWSHSGATPVTSTIQEDFIDSVTVFGGVKKNIISKNFRGGELTTILGGSELNLMQADVPERVVLEITQVLGGTKLIVPAHWKIHAEEVVNVFGGLDDKRLIQNVPDHDAGKMLILKGTNLFGGIEIRSF